MPKHVEVSTAYLCHAYIMLYVFRAVVFNIQVLFPTTARMRNVVKLRFYMFRNMIPMTFQGKNILSTSGYENNYIN